ncbi:MAG: hypothetical protein ACJ0J5_07190 [Dehalococcoidia bacterium]
MFPFPEDGYKGKQVEEISNKVIAELSIKKENLEEIEDKKIKDESINITLEQIKKDLSDMGINYDNWFFESSLFLNDTIQIVENKLKEKKINF